MDIFVGETISLSLC